MICFRCVREIEKSDYFLHNVCLSVRPPVRIEQFSSQWKNFCEILWLSIFKKSVERIKVSLKSDKNNRNLHQDVSSFTISRLILLRMRNDSDKKCRKTKSNFTFNNTYSRKLCRL